MSNVALYAMIIAKSRERVSCGLLLRFSIQEVNLLLMQAGSSNRSEF